MACSWLNAWQGTTGGIVIMRRVQQRHQTGKKKVYYAFVDLEKEFTESRGRW